MPNLTQEQMTLLKWMKAGHQFQVCSDYCPHRGEVYPKTRLPITIYQKTLHKLKKEGLVSFEPKLVMGIRWDVFSLTERGKAIQ
ncbi:hypothetical protein ACPV54_13040 [Vibrio mediterranei]